MSAIWIAQQVHEELALRVAYQRRVVVDVECGGHGMIVAE